MANILVTGGSRGIGAAIAKKFAEQGDTVYITYCKSKEAAQVLEQQYGIHPIFADFREERGAFKSGKAIAEQIGTIDTLVNNAAISVVDVFQCVSEEDCTALYRVNLFGTVDMTRAILPTMLQQHAGNIINITSVWGQTGASCEVDYSVTKGGIIAFTKALAKEVAPSGIRVNAVSPGVIDTEMNERNLPKKHHCSGLESRRKLQMLCFSWHRNEQRLLQGRFCQSTGDFSSNKQYCSQ